MRTFTGAQATPIEQGGLHAQVDALLTALREQGRRAIRIVDLDCGTGRRIRRVARRARALGFLAVEARGCTRSGSQALAAARAGSKRRDPAIGYQFDAIEPGEALLEERQDADLVIGSRRPAPASRTPGSTEPRA